MIAFLKAWLPIIGPILAVLFGGFAVREHVLSQQPGFSASIEVGGLPASEVTMGAAALASLIGAIWAAWRKPAASEVGGIQADEQSHIGSLIAQYSRDVDPVGIDFMRDLSVHRNKFKEGAVPVPEPEPKPLNERYVTQARHIPPDIAAAL